MSRFADRRVWLGGGTLVALIIVALSWFTLIGPEVSSAHELRDQAVATEQQNDLLAAKASSLQAKSKHLVTYTSSLRQALSALPYSSGLPAFTRQLNTQAKAHHVELLGVTVGGVTPVVATTPVATTAKPAAPTTPTTPTVAGSLFSIQVSVHSSGSLVDQRAFLNDVRTIGPRRALITSTQVSPGDGAKNASIDDRSSLTAQLTIFAAPRSPDQVKQLTRLLAGDLDG